MSANTQKYTEIKEEFTVWQKIIERKNASKDTKLIKKRTKNIIQSYNNIVIFLRPIFNEKNEDAKVIAKKRLLKFREKLISCLQILERAFQHN